MYGGANMIGGNKEEDVGGLCNANCNKHEGQKTAKKNYS
jgi:hypothetical protein